MLSPLEKLNQALRENRPQDFMTARHGELGMQPLQFGPGTSLWEWDATRDLVLNAFGYVAGGFLAVFADELLGSAIGSVLEPGEFATTAEMKVSFLKPVPKGLVRGEGKVLRKGKSVAFVEAIMKNAKDEPVATVSSTWTIVVAKN
ncbi:MAG: PaaI family thioesterase [Candidatus Binatia bacterium]